MKRSAPVLGVSETVCASKYEIWWEINQFGAIMCGICGISEFNGGKPVDYTTIESMCRAIKHRGPNDEGMFVDDHIGLGMTRLKIIDLETGHQPIFNEDKTICIVFNGEIYNYKELRNLLSKKNHRFSTQSDTEVIVHLYEEYGYDCLHKLSGMFAFAIWDKRTRKLFIARDRLGEKPLIYYHDKERFIFGSEMKSILECEGIDRKIDLEALYHYLTFMSIPAPYTIFEGIRKLLPGHYIICDPERGVTVRRYWDVSFEEQKEETREDHYVDKLRHLLRESVRERLISDVPLGAFLSGGLDSSSVVALMSQLSNGPVKTFSIGFEGPSYYNELEYSRLVAKQFGTEHHELMVRPDIVNILPKLVWHWDEPFAISSAIPIYYLARMAKEHVTVALTGDGGDELFAGYSRYLWDREAEVWSRIPRGMLKALSTGLGLLNPSVSNRGSNLVRRLKKYTHSLTLDRDSRYVFYMSRFKDTEKSNILSPDLNAEFQKRSVSSESILANYYRQFDGKDNLDRRLYGDIKASLADEMLTKVDKMTMAVGLEARPPLLAHELVEFTAATPSEYKLNGRTRKYILKEAMKSIVPDTIMYRRKHGFEVPLDEWIRDELRDFTRDLLSEANIKRRGMFDHNYVNKMLDLHDNSVGNFGHHIWILLVFELWCRAFIDRV